LTPLASPFQEALNAQTAFVKSVTVTATRNAETETLEPGAGQLTQDARRSMRWDGSISIPVETNLLPTTPNDLLTPFGTLVQVRFGVVLANTSTDDVPYGSYYIESSDVRLTGDSRVVDLVLVDPADRLARYRFESPFDIPPSTDIADAVNMVILDRLGVDPELDATGTVLARSRILGLEPELDPWRELEELVEGFGYRIWYDRNGNLVLDRPPIPDPTLAVALMGELTITGTFDHRPPNVVVARGETSDDTTPIQAVALDDDSSSPTYAGTTPGQSAYGRVTRFFASPLLVTQGQADLAAQNILTTEAGRAATWDVSKAYEPTIDPDDVLTIPLGDGLVLPLSVDAVTVNIAGDTSMACRAISALVE
jgi:hypothetical protein